MKKKQQQQQQQQEQQSTRNNGFSILVQRVNSSTIFLRSSKDKLFHDQTALADLIESSIENSPSMSSIVRRDMMRAFARLPKFLQNRILYPK